MTTAILGWGSLNWDDPPSFADWHENPWKPDGPQLNLEFSRVSESRQNALTLVIDELHGELCRVSYALSNRMHFIDAVADLRCREGCNWKSIGQLQDPAKLAGKTTTQSEETIRLWAVKMGFDAVIWTALRSNFQNHVKKPFTVDDALSHLKSLEPAAKVKAAEYIWRAPEFVNTPLRRAVQIGPWF